METRKTYPEFMEALRRLAPELDVALIDHHAEWERVRLQDDDLYQSWMSDAIHPNALGHWVFAERTLKELEIGPLERTKPPVSGTPFVRTMRVSRLLPGAGKLDGLRYPHALSPLGFQRRKFTGRFCDVHAEFGARAPEDLLIYFACQVECAEPMGLVAQLGYDGPVKLWMDGVEEFHDPNGTNPAEPDMARVWFQAGRGPHEILVALGSNRGNAWGIFLRLERASTSHRVGALDGISLTSR
jgi:hypothetical protein